MPYGLSLVTAPAGEPVSVADLRNMLRLQANYMGLIERDDNDPLLESTLAAARRFLERAGDRQLVTATWRLTLDAFPGGDGVVRLPRPPLQSVTSVKYYNAAGTLTTLASSEYQVDARCEPGRLAPAYGKSWPYARDQMAAVEVVYAAGYGTADVVPESWKRAIRELSAYWYEHPIGVVPPLGGAQMALPTSVLAVLAAEHAGHFGGY